MATDVADTEDRVAAGEGGHRGLAWAVLATAVAQVVAPAVTLNGPGESPGSGSGPDLLISPVGWAFSIWGVIYTLAIVQAIAVLVVGARGVPRRLLIDQLVLHLAAVAWIVCAGLDSSVATALALTVMFVAAVDAVITAARATAMPRGVFLLTSVAVGLYAGWVSAAFFLNVSTALVDADITSVGELGWQLVMLIVASAVLAIVLVAARGTPTYAAAGIWALIGIGVTGRDDGNAEVVWTASIAAVVIALVAVGIWATRLRGRSARSARP